MVAPHVDLFTLVRFNIILSHFREPLNTKVQNNQSVLTIKAKLEERMVVLNKVKQSNGMPWGAAYWRAG